MQPEPHNCTCTSCEIQQLRASLAHAHRRIDALVELVDVLHPQMAESNIQMGLLWEARQDETLTGLEA